MRKRKVGAWLCSNSGDLVFVEGRPLLLFILALGNRHSSLAPNLLPRAGAWRSPRPLPSCGARPAHGTAAPPLPRRLRSSSSRCTAILLTGAARVGNLRGRTASSGAGARAPARPSRRARASPPSRRAQEGDLVAGAGVAGGLASTWTPAEAAWAASRSSASSPGGAAWPAVPSGTQSSASRAVNRERRGAGAGARVDLRSWSSSPPPENAK